MSEGDQDVIIDMRGIPFDMPQLRQSESLHSVLMKSTRGHTCRWCGGWYLHAHSGLALHAGCWRRHAHRLVRMGDHAPL